MEDKVRGVTPFRLISTRRAIIAYQAGHAAILTPERAAFVLLPTGRRKVGEAARDVNKNQPKGEKSDPSDVL
jgi:hypothetical protein